MPNIFFNRHIHQVYDLKVGTPREGGMEGRKKGYLCTSLLSHTHEYFLLVSFSIGIGPFALYQFERRGATTARRQGTGATRTGAGEEPTRKGERGLPSLPPSLHPLLPHPFPFLSSSSPSPRASGHDASNFGHLRFLSSREGGGREGGKAGRPAAAAAAAAAAVPTTHHSSDPSGRKLARVHRR